MSHLLGISADDVRSGFVPVISFQQKTGQVLPCPVNQFLSAPWGTKRIELNL
jgi:hypothetical protein